MRFDSMVRSPDSRDEAAMPFNRRYLGMQRSLKALQVPQMLKRSSSARSSKMQFHSIAQWEARHLGRLQFFGGETRTGGE
jgi:hypothetical protein